MGEEVDATKPGGREGEFSTEEYTTGNVGPEEYDYSYRDYSDPSPETGEVHGDIGPALSAVTDEGGVSRFASEAPPPPKKTFQPTLKFCQIVFNVSLCDSVFHLLDSIAERLSTRLLLCVMEHQTMNTFVLSSG